TPKLRIDTQALWWGRAVEETNAAISIVNETAAALAGQNYKTFKYPFASMLVTENQLLIDESNIWMDKTGQGKLSVKLFNEDGTLYNSTLTAYSIRNMLDVENVLESEDINARFQAELQKNIKAGASLEVKDKFAQAALDFISGIKFGNDNFSLLLAPTSDPTVFNGILQLNAGDDVMDMGPEEDGFSLMLDDDEVESIGTGKAGFARARELASGLKDDIESLTDDSSGGSFKYQAGGYFSCKVYYDFASERWEIQPIGGGIRAGIGFDYSKSGTEFLGYVPVTYEIALGAAVRLEFDAHMLCEPVSFGGIDYHWQAEYDSVTDYLTNLRIKAYIYAFGGLGIDYTIIALKIGVFGQLELENENKFLNRNYLNAALADQKALSGSKLGLKGQVGIKFVAKILFISYKKTLASAGFSKEWTYRNWDRIEQYWQETTGDMLTMDNMSLATRMYAAATGQDMIVISAAPVLESRDYLNDYARAWGTAGEIRSALTLDENNLAPSTLQSNAYPYANPLIADDGSVFVYLSDNNSPDVWDTTANYAVKEGGSYADKGAINTEAGSFGDSQLAFASNNALAISAWTRLTDKVEKNAGDELSNAEISMMMNNSEVYASIYQGSSWMTERLTNNSMPDMAPVVATNGSKAIVAWRSVYAGDESDPINFNGKDTIVYRIYDGSSWSAARTLYNGVSGRVTGLEAAMLSDGTAAISYILDTSEAKDTSSYELVYGVVASNDDIVNNVRLTNDNSADENPQLAIARINHEERFLLGWYKMEGQKSDIRLATFGNDGSPREDFIDSLYAVSSGSNISGNFKFVNTSTANQDFKNLSILWVEPNTDDASDSLKAIKFMQETVDGTELIFTSAAVDVAKMPDKTVIDSFDAYVSNAANDEVKVVILGTESKEEFDTISDGNGNTINVPRTESKMFTATEVYQNKAAIKAADFDCSEIMSGFSMPIAFTVQNQGKELITSVTLEYGTGEYGTEGYSGESKTFDNLKILPGSSHTLLINYAVPEKIADLTYRGTAAFGGTQIEMTGGGTLPLAVADLGISKISIIKEMDGLREFAVTLYNSSDYKLSSSGKKVKLAIYDNSSYTAGSEVVPVVSITDPDELSLIDNGAYIANLSFDIKSYLLGKGKDEIPANGVTLYARAWITDDSDKELAEFVGENNFTSILCENLVKRNGGNAVKVDVKQSNSATATTSVLTLQNLAMRAITGGNVAVNLLDQGGNIIKTQYLSNTAESLVNLGSEAVICKTFVFDTLGADVEAYYFNPVAGSMNADLQILAASGVGVNFDKDTTSYDDLKANNLKSTNITAISANPNAKVLLKDAVDTVLAEKTGAVAYTLPLLTGSNSFKVTVEPDGPGAQPKTYILNVTNSGNDDPINMVVSVNPATASVKKGSSQQFTAAVSGNNPPQTVIWTVTGGIAGTSISNTGLLSIAAAETATTLTVTATSTVNSAISGTATVTVSESLTPPGPNTGGSGGGGGISQAPVNSSTGSANVTPLYGGKVGLGNSAMVSIPAGALSGNSVLEVTVSKQSSPPALSSGFSLLGNVYEFKVGNAGSYQFNKPVTLTFTFDPKLVPEGSKPEVYYYDNSKSQWVNLGGEVSGQSIKVTVDHFTAFAVIVRSKSAVQIPVEKPEVRPEAVVLSDIAGHWAESSILRLISSGIIKGYPDGSFRPNAEISRAEFACILVKALELTAQKGKVFNDTALHWAGDYIATAEAYGIVSGFDSSTFGPDQCISREQMAVMLAKAKNLVAVSGDTSFEDNKDISSWAKEAVVASVKAGIMKGYPDNSFIPQGKATRAEAVIVIVNSTK
ncbi:MAG: S-layer homology domain-containing protein, partial [Syntrophomonas sp.]|nr:S-layer homology domain-containing protein [Syntrophomonas sp.]